MVGMLRKMDDGRSVRARNARLWIIAVALFTTALVTPAAASAASGFVTVDDVVLQRDGGRATISATVTWDRASAVGDDQMSAGDLRAVAVSDQGHHATILATKAVRGIDESPRQSVTLAFDGADRLAAIRPGNRVVLTATQHMPVRAGSGQRTSRSYVTVGQAQPFGSPQDRIGRRDCAAVAVRPGAKLNRCDLVGADFDDARISERYPQGGDTGTRMLLADLTGATAQRSDMTGTSFAGGRLNDADLTEADISNVSMARTEATDLHAAESASDREEGTAGADLFAADLRRADFHGATLNGASFGRATLTDANFRGASWRAFEAQGTDFHGADLRDVDSLQPLLDFADLADAKLRGSSFLTTDLTWSILCHTAMPTAAQDADADRDCRATVDPGPKSVQTPLIDVYGGLHRTARPVGVVIVGTVRWNADARDPAGANLRAGDVRIVAVDAKTGTATTIATRTYDSVPAVSGIVLSVNDQRKLAALAPGNRVVLTASQHAYRSAVDPTPTTQSYVTVDTLQAGPGRGRVGSLDCSDRPVVPGGGYDFCDLAGATLDHAELVGPMSDVDLSGASLESSTVSGTILSGSALGSVDADYATFTDVTAVQAHAPELSLAHGALNGSHLRAATLAGANFAGTNIADTTFATTPMRGAILTKARITHVDFGYAGLAHAQLDDLTVERENSLFMADLTDATLKGPRWPRDESGDVPYEWATLCRTTLPEGAVDTRDCLG